MVQLIRLTVTKAASNPVCSGCKSIVLAINLLPNATNESLPSTGFQGSDSNNNGIGLLSFISLFHYFTSIVMVIIILTSNKKDYTIEMRIRKRSQG